MSTLKGQTILIIGGSAGIGYGVALAALQSHASKVIIASSSQARLDDAVNRLRKEEGIINGLFHGDIETKVLNANDLNSVKTVVESVGEIDHLVFTSGDHLRMVDFKTANVEAMKEALDIRYWAAVQAAQSAKIKKGGSITFTIGSVVAKPAKNWTFIAGGAGALDAAMRGLAVDLAPIRVNTVAPGAVLTDLWGPEGGELRDRIANFGKEKLLVQHSATAAEIAEAYLFTMKCGFITGQTLHVNGGVTLV